MMDNTISLIPQIMSLHEELKKRVGSGRKHHFAVEENGIIYVLDLKASEYDHWIDVSSVYITPRGQGGFKNLLSILLSLGVKKVIISKVVNARLAEYLSRLGWELKASKKGNWIEFHQPPS